jgi:hypothetical protein
MVEKIREYFFFWGGGLERENRMSSPTSFFFTTMPMHGKHVNCNLSAFSASFELEYIVIIEQNIIGIWRNFRNSRNRIRLPADHAPAVLKKLIHEKIDTETNENLSFKTFFST